MWERTLQDLVRGLRANKKDEAKFIAKAVDEIRQEIKGDDMELKAGAVLKLTYLDMLGYDMSWASFHVVEVMSSSKVHLKSIGYLAAAQTFEQDTDVLMLTTNLLKKDLTAMPADVAITLDGLSHIVTPELARDLSPELIAMLNHSRPHIRKRAILALYKFLVKHPEAINYARDRLEEKLNDLDPAVVAATVNVLCELARRKPEDYLSLAPQLFHLLTSSSNNWMLIKIIKLFGSLSPHEPRLVKKLQPPITELISTTPAISLLYECVHTCIIGGMLRGSSGDSLAKMCVLKLAAFIQDADQNLKYIALLAMAKIVPSHPHLVADYQDTILAAVSDQDISIRMRALDLISAMVNRSNLQSIVQQLLAHLVRDPSSLSLPTAAQALVQNASGYSSNTAKAFISPTQSPAYRLILSKSILNMCSQSTYENVTNFEWYLSVLVDLAHVADVNVGSEIREQLVNVVGRVRASRPYAVKLMYTLISDDAMLRNASVESSCSEVLWAAAWICGEYCQELAEPQKLLPYLLQPEVSNLAPDIIAVYIQALTKIFGFWASELGQRWNDDELPNLKGVIMSIRNRVGELAGCQDIEVQERAANILQLFNFISADIHSYLPNMRVTPSSPFPGSSSHLDGPPPDELRFPKSLYLIQPLISPYELNPVAATAQASVVPPEGLNLDTWFVEPPSDVTHVQAGDADVGKTRKMKKGKARDLASNANLTSKKTSKNGDEALINTLESDLKTSEETALRDKRRAERLAQLRDDPYYIIDDRPSKAVENVDSIPVVHLEDLPPIIDEWESKLPSLRATSQNFYSQAFVVEREGEMPDGAVAQRPHLFSSSTNNLAPSRSLADSSTSSFPSYQPSGFPSSNLSAAPDPIKVVRPKKKATSKKKQTVAAANTPSL